MILANRCNLLTLINSQFLVLSSQFFVFSSQFLIPYSLFFIGFVERLCGTLGCIIISAANAEILQKLCPPGQHNRSLVSKIFGSAPCGMQYFATKCAGQNDKKTLQTILRLSNDHVETARAEGSEAKSLLITCQIWQVVAMVKVSGASDELMNNIPPLPGDDVMDF